MVGVYLGLGFQKKKTFHFVVYTLLALLFSAKPGFASGSTSGFTSGVVCDRMVEEITWHSHRFVGARQHYLNLTPDYRPNIPDELQPTFLRAENGVVVRVPEILDSDLGQGPFQIEEQMISTSVGDSGRRITVRKPDLEELKQYEDKKNRGETPEPPYYYTLFSIFVDTQGNVLRLTFLKNLEDWFVSKNPGEAPRPAGSLRWLYAKTARTGGGMSMHADFKDQNPDPSDVVGNFRPKIELGRDYTPQELYGMHSNFSFPFAIGSTFARRPVFGDARSAFAERNDRYTTNLVLTLYYSSDGKLESASSVTERWNVDAALTYPLSEIYPLTRSDENQIALETQASLKPTDRRVRQLERVQPLKDLRLIARETPPLLSFRDGKNRLTVDFAHLHSNIAFRGIGAYSFFYSAKPALRALIADSSKMAIGFPAAPYEWSGTVDAQSETVELVQIWPEPQHHLLRQFLASNDTVYKKVMEHLEKNFREAASKDLAQLKEKGRRRIPKNIPALPRLSQHDLYVFHTNDFQWKVSISDEGLVGTFRDETGKQVFAIPNGEFPQFVQARIATAKQRRAFRENPEQEDKLHLYIAHDNLALIQMEIAATRINIDQFADHQLHPVDPSQADEEEKSANRSPSTGAPVESGVPTNPDKTRIIR